MSDGRSIDLYLLSQSPKSRAACDLDLIHYHAWTVSIVRLPTVRQRPLHCFAYLCCISAEYSSSVYPMCIYPCYLLGAGAEEMYPPALLLYFGGGVYVVSGEQMNKCFVTEYNPMKIKSKIFHCKWQTCVGCNVPTSLNKRYNLGLYTF